MPGAVWVQFWARVMGNLLTVPGDSEVNLLESLSQHEWELCTLRRRNQMMGEREWNGSWIKYLLAASSHWLNPVKGLLWGSWVFVIAGQPAVFHPQKWCWCLSHVFLKGEAWWILNAAVCWARLWAQCLSTDFAYWKNDHDSKNRNSGPKLEKLDAKNT